MAMFMVVGCEKDESKVDTTAIVKDPHAILHSLKVDDRGRIVFRDFEELSIVSSELEKMTSKERLDWESIIGFKSYNSSLLDAARAINSAETEEEFYQSLANNTRFYFFQLLDKLLTEG